MSTRPTRSTRVTLAQVAAHAGVSTTTVSVILSGRAEGLRQFHPDTITRVRDSAAQLGYRANLFASSLNADTSPFFALIIQDVGMDNDTDTERRSRRAAQWYFWAFEGELLAGVINEAARSGLHPIIATAEPAGDTETMPSIERIIAGGVFGTIARTPPPTLEKYLRFKQSQGHRMVVIFPQELDAWPTNAIDVDNVAIGKCAAHLLQRDRRQHWGIVHRQHDTDPHLRRTQGFQQVAKELGVAVETIQLPAQVDEITAGDYIAQVVRGLGLDGMFALDSVTSIGSLLGCMQAGLRPGDSIDIVGCDSSLWQSSPLPRITSVDISWKRVGETALMKLAGLSTDGETEFDTVLIEPEITPGATCPVPPEMLPEPPASS